MLDRKNKKINIAIMNIRFNLIKNLNDKNKLEIEFILKHLARPYYEKKR